MIYIISTSHMISLTSNIFTMSAIPLRPPQRWLQGPCCALPSLICQATEKLSKYGWLTSRDLCRHKLHNTPQKSLLPIGREKLVFKNFSF